MKSNLSFKLNYSNMKPEPRQNWEAPFQEMHANGDDELLIADIFEDEKFEEYDAQIGAENKD
jgi:antitoxin MazE